LGGVPCTRCFGRNLVCVPQQPLSEWEGREADGENQGGSSNDGCGGGGGGGQLTSSGGDEGSGAFVATFLERWQPADVASPFVEAVLELVEGPPPNRDSVAGGGAASAGVGAAEPTAATEAGLLDRGLVAAAM
jgi:hypothetical protein